MASKILAAAAAVACFAAAPALALPVGASATVTDLHFILHDLRPRDGVDPSIDGFAGNSYVRLAGNPAVAWPWPWPEDSANGSFLAPANVVESIDGLHAFSEVGPGGLYSVVSDDDPESHLPPASYVAGGSSAFGYFTVSAYTAVTISALAVLDVDNPHSIWTTSSSASLTIYRDDARDRVVSLSATDTDVTDRLQLTFFNLSAEAVTLQLAYGTWASVRAVPEPPTALTALAGLLALGAWLSRPLPAPARGR